MIVEWKTGKNGEIKAPKIFNLPGVDSRSVTNKTSPEFMSLLKTAVDDDLDKKSTKEYAGTVKKNNEAKVEISEETMGIVVLEEDEKQHE